MRKLFLGILLLGALPGALRAATINASSCSESNVQSAINSANKGDTVQVPGGSGSWSSLSLPPGVTLNGGGCSVSGSMSMTMDGSSLPRLTNFKFSSSAQAIFINVYGEGPGLIDHNAFTGGAASEMIHNLGDGAEATSGWSDSVTPGGPNALYVEDNTFTFNCSGNPCYFYGSSAIQSYYGARTVVRHNTMTNVQVDQHGTAGNIGARWWEIYDNTFITSANANQSNYMAIRAGSGVIWGNTHSGPNSGGGSIELYEEDSGYPALYQIGRGISENYSPAYVWGNGADMDVGSGSSNVVEGRDFIVSNTQPATMMRWQSSSDNASTTYSYVPYTYPYPTGTTQQQAVMPPTNIQISVH